MEKIIKKFPAYSIDDKGVVRVIETGKVKKQSLGKNGYYYVTLYNDGYAKKLYIHRLLMETFVPNPEGKATVNHKNGIKTDNRLENLEWATHAENLSHALKVGLRKPRDRKLNKHQLKEIYDKFRNSTSETITSLAQEYGVSLTQLSIWIRKYAEEHGLAEEYETLLKEKKLYRARNRKKRPQRLSKASSESE